MRCPFDNMELILAVFLSTICTAVGYKISSCDSNGILNIKETSPQSLTCTEIADDYMFWDFTPSGGTEVRRIASCTWSTSTCNITDNDSDYAVTRAQYGTSTLTVRRNHAPNIAGVVRCGGAFNVTETLPAACNVRVVYPAKRVTNCYTHVDSRDWTVYGTCYVPKIYNPDNVYSCQWIHVSPSGQQTNFTQAMSVSSFRDNGFDYQKGLCSFSGQPMLTTDGVHIYNLRIDPGENLAGNNIFLGERLTIQHPAEPVLSNCPPVVLQDDDIDCRCDTSGSPPAVVTWYGSRVINNYLTLRNVSRSLDGQNFTCNQYWGKRTSILRSTTYSLQVHYPPSSPPLISGIQDGGHSEGETLTLSCSVTGGKPPISFVSFLCGQGPGDSPDTTSTVNSLTTVTSYLTFERLDSTVNGTVCRCSPYWKEDPSRYTQTATATITVIASSGDSTAPETSTSSTEATSQTSKEVAISSNTICSNTKDSAQLAILIGGVVGGVAVVIIIALVIVIVVIWKRRCDPVYTKPTPSGQDDASPYTELSVFERVVGQASGATQQVNSGFQQEEAMEQAQCENTGTEMQPAPYERKFENTATRKQPAPPESHNEN